jgi:hypothetical protein
MKLTSYQARGFRCLDNIAPQGLISLAVAAVDIKKGDYLYDDTNGYATNAGITEGSLVAYGIAAEDCSNAGGSSGDLSVLVIPILSGARFSVPVSTTGLITRSHIGAAIELANAYSVDSSDATVPTGGIALFVEDIDVSAEAIDANAYGYAIGRFRVFAP